MATRRPWPAPRARVRFARPISDFRVSTDSGGTSFFLPHLWDEVLLDLAQEGFGLEVGHPDGECPPVPRILVLRDLVDVVGAGLSDPDAGDDMPVLAREALVREAAEVQCFGQTRQHIGAEPECTEVLASPGEEIGC